MDTGEWWGQPGYPSSRSQRQGSCLSTGRLTSAQRALRASCQGQECKNDTASAGGNPGPGAAEISVSCVQGPRPRRPRDCCPSAHQAPPGGLCQPAPARPYLHTAPPQTTPLPDHASAWPRPCQAPPPPAPFQSPASARPRPVPPPQSPTYAQATPPPDPASGLTAPTPCGSHVPRESSAEPRPDVPSGHAPSDPAHTLSTSPPTPGP